VCEKAGRPEHRRLASRYTYCGTGMIRAALPKGIFVQGGYGDSRRRVVHNQSSPFHILINVRCSAIGLVNVKRNLRQLLKIGLLYSCIDHGLHLLDDTPREGKKNSTTKESPATNRGPILVVHLRGNTLGMAKLEFLKIIICWSFYGAVSILACQPYSDAHSIDPTRLGMYYRLTVSCWN